MDATSMHLSPGHGSTGERRLAALRAAGLLDAPAEERFDRLTRLARQLLRAPVALVSLLDADRQFFLSAQGLAEPWTSLRQTPLSHSFCRAVVETGLPMSVSDAREDARVRGNPAVAELGAVAYLAVPLALPDDCVVGALCAIDREPRAWTTQEEGALRDLADAVEAEMVGGLRLREAEAAAAALRESEERYRALFQAIDTGFCIVEVKFDGEQRPTDYRFVEVNPAFAAQTGLAGAAGKWMRELAPDHEQHWFDTYGRIALTGEALRFENVAAALGRWYDVYAFRIGEPEARRVAILFNDISDRRRAEAALRESEARYRALFEVSPQMVWFADAEGRCTYVNRHYADFVGLAAERALGDGWLAVVSPEDRGCARAAWAGAVASEGSYEVEYRIRRGSDGSHRWFLVRGAPLRGPDGRIERWIGVGIDIDDRRRAEEALRRRTRELELLSEAAAGLLSAGDPDGVLRPLFRSLADEFGLDVAFSFVVDEGGDGLRLASCFGVTEGAKVGLARLAFGQAVCGTVAQTRRAMCVAGVQASGDPTVRLVKGLGVRAYACFPLLAAGDRPLGTLFFGSRRRDRLSEGDVAFLGAIARYVAVVRERLDAEMALRASEERFRRAMGIGTVGVLFFGLDGRITDANAAFERMSGYSRDELLAIAHWAVLTPPEFADATARAAAELAERGETAPFEKQMVRKDGSRWWGLFAPTRLSGTGWGAGCVEFIVDITERKRAEAALRASEARLRELQAELLHVSRLSAAGEMAAALAHELNQPLAAATSAVQAARRTLASASPGGPDGQPPEVREAMDLAAEQARRAGQVVRRLRDFVARGEAEPRLESLPKLVEEAAALALVGAKERGVAVALRVEPGLPPVLVDRIQVEQVLFNLMRNALEAMDGGAAPADGSGGDAPRHRQLVVAARAADPGTVEVAVADTGPGLAAEVAGRLFEPFVSTKPDGMGVGLSICRTIVEAHGGRLWAEPNPGGGAVFRFTLPSARPQGAGVH
jgi:two-component system, LuxR family, sensor kinase FixL